LLEDIEIEAEKKSKNKSKTDRLSSIDNLLKRNGIDLDEVGKVQAVKLYQMGYVDKDGDAKSLDLTGITLSPTWEEGPKWPVVQQAAPVVIKSAPKKSPTLLKNWKCAVFLPDPQFGFTLADKLHPFHDQSALDTALSVIRVLADNYKVDKIVNLGDYLDLPSMSKYIQQPGFASTTQMAIDEGHIFLAQQRDAVPNTDIVVLEGNHDKRMKDFVVVNAKAAFGLKRAGQPDSWPVMSVPYLLRCDDLRVEYIDAYPAGQYWVNDNLRAIHGTSVVSGGSTAAKYVKDYPGISTIFGHAHRIEQQYQTKQDRKGPVTTLAASPGCLCRIDGNVPSVNSGLTADGSPVTSYENWQQGIGWALYNDRGEFYYHSAHIVNGRTIVEGEEIVG
jgi:hypothetical protein